MSTPQARLTEGRKRYEALAADTAKIDQVHAERLEAFRKARAAGADFGDMEQHQAALSNVTAMRETHREDLEAVQAELRDAEAEANAEARAAASQAARDQLADMLTERAQLEAEAEDTMRNLAQRWTDLRLRMNEALRNVTPQDRKDDPRVRHVNAHEWPERLNARTFEAQAFENTIRRGRS